MTVTLDNGAKAIVELPKGKLFVAGARIELEVHARDAPSGTMLAYKFVRYHDAPAGPDSD